MKKNQSAHQTVFRGITHGAYTYAAARYPQHTDLADAMNIVARQFVDNPSFDTYPALNRALRGVETGKEWESSHEEVNAPQRAIFYFDLLGRKVTDPQPHKIYVTSNGEKVLL